jgi:hypothetical protein
MLKNFKIIDIIKKLIMIFEYYYIFIINFEKINIFDNDIWKEVKNAI